MPLADELVDLLKAWEAAAAPDDPWIVDQAWQRRCTSSYSTLVFRQHLAALGIPVQDAEGRARHLHSLRHTHAILMTAAGADSLRLRLALGHAGEAMTAHYASAAIRFMQQCRKWQGQLRLRSSTALAAPEGPAAAVVPTVTLAIPWPTFGAVQGRLMAATRPLDDQQQPNRKRKRPGMG